MDEVRKYLNGYGKQVCKIVRLKKEIESGDREKLIALEKENDLRIKFFFEIMDLINKLPNLENDVLFYRYIKGYRWDVVSNLLGCSESYAFKIHKRALNEISGKIFNRDV